MKGGKRCASSLEHSKLVGGVLFTGGERRKGHQKNREERAKGSAEQNKLDEKRARVHIFVGSFFDENNGTRRLSDPTTLHILPPLHEYAHHEPP